MMLLVSRYEEQGKYLQKMNTFVDFADCAIHLIEREKLTAADRIAAVGRSAGGLLVGAGAYPHTYKRRTAFTYIHTCMHTCIILAWRHEYSNYVRTYMHKLIHTCIRTYLQTYIHRCR